MITIVGATDPGCREHNEDCYAAESLLGLGLVADGMGGYACGEVASAIVRDTILEAARNNERPIDAIVRAHAAVREAVAADKKKTGMGSTAIALKTQGYDYEISWVGDSRAYLWDPGAAGGGELKQITRDHSYVESLLANGAISHQESLNHPNKNLITQAVGAAANSGLEIDVITGRLAAGQQLLLCSDGLVDMVGDPDIAATLASAANPEHALHLLIDAALQGGGLDNITVVIAIADQDGDKTVSDADIPAIISSCSASGQYQRHDTPASENAVLNRPANLYASQTLPPVVAPEGILSSLRSFAQQHSPWLAVGCGLLIIILLAFILG